MNKPILIFCALICIPLCAVPKYSMAQTAEIDSTRYCIQANHGLPPTPQQMAVFNQCRMMVLNELHRQQIQNQQPSLNDVGNAAIETLDSGHYVSPQQAVQNYAAPIQYPIQQQPRQMNCRTYEYGGELKTECQEN